MIKCVCPWTGGVDTTSMICCLLDSGYEIYPYHVDYGGMNYPAEQWAMEKILPEFRSLRTPGYIHDVHEMMYYIPDLKYQWNTGDPSTINTSGVQKTSQDPARYSWDVPFRNAILFSMGVAYAENLKIDTLMLQIEDTKVTGVPGADYRDDSIEFIEAFNKMCLVGSFVHVECPILGWDSIFRYQTVFDWAINQYVNVGRCNYPRWADGEYIACEKCLTCVSSKHILKGLNGSDDGWSG